MLLCAQASIIRPTRVHSPNSTVRRSSRWEARGRDAGGAVNRSRRLDVVMLMDRTSREPPGGVPPGAWAGSARSRPGETEELRARARVLAHGAEQGRGQRAG